MKSIFLIIPFLFLPLLIHIGVIKAEYRLWTLAVFFIVTAIFAFEKFSLYELGLRTDNLSESLGAYTIATILLFISLIVLAKILRTKKNFA